MGEIRGDAGIVLSAFLDKVDNPGHADGGEQVLVFHVVYFPPRDLVAPRRKIDSPGRTRTCDMLINSQPLYRLSYRGMRLLYSSHR